MIAAPSRIVIMARLTAGSPRHVPARAITAFLVKTTIVIAVQTPGQALQHPRRAAHDSTASASTLGPDPLDHDCSTVKSP